MPKKGSRNPLARDKTYIQNRVTIDGDTGCWNWNMSLTEKGYGYFQVTIWNGSLSDREVTNFSSHRRAYELWNGPVTSGLYVLHDCDNRKCCNPDHLYQGTQQDNVDDMWERGRANVPRGEEHPHALLSEEQVREIRDTPKYYGVLNDLSKKYGVAKPTISRVRGRESWKHVKNAAVIHESLTHLVQRSRL